MYNWGMIFYRLENEMGVEKDKLFRRMEVQEHFILYRKIAKGWFSDNLEK